MICVHKAQKIEFQKKKNQKFGIFLIFFEYLFFFGTTQGARLENYFYDDKTFSHKNIVENRSVDFLSIFVIKFTEKNTKIM